MDAATIEKLAQVHTFPAVSILCPFDRKRPGNPQDALQLKTLRNEAVDRLMRDYEGRESSAIVDRIDEMVRQVDLQHPPAAVGLFVTAAEAHLVELPVAVPERVVVAETFALRELVGALQRSGRARVLVLSQHCVRCFDAVAGRLNEVLRDGFPALFERPASAAVPHRDLPIGEREHAETIRNSFRAVESALCELQARDHLPVVLVGTARDIAFYREIMACADDLVGQVEGNYAHTDAHALQPVVAPELDRYFEARRAAACARVAETSTRIAVGIDATWAAARAGRGHELVVEETFRYPARVVEGRLEPASADANDAVDEVIDTVLRKGGTVVTVAPGALADDGGIALLLRY